MKVKTQLKAGQVGAADITQSNSSTVMVSQTNSATVGGGGGE
jgi:hypothetical protein